MTKDENLLANNKDIKNLSIKTTFLIVVISFALSIIDMGLISGCDYYIGADIEAIISFLMDAIVAVAFLVGIIISSVYVAKKRIGISILVVNIILFVIWALTAVCSFFNVLCTFGPWLPDTDDSQYYVNVSQYHFNFVYYEHYCAYVDSRTLTKYVNYDYCVPYILFIGNLIMTSIIIPLYVKEYVKHKSEHQTE